MAEGFIGGLNRQLIVWSGWVFTVGGAIAALVIGKEYWWIGGLVVVVGLLALMTFAYLKHRELQEARASHAADIRRLSEGHTVEVERLTVGLREATHQAEEAVRKLNEVPADTLLRIQEIITANSFPQWLRRLVTYADYVERMMSFSQLSTRALSLRTFVKKSGSLYAVARIDTEAAASLRDADPFVLTHKDGTGLVTESARLLVHQRNETEGTVWFRVVEYISDEMPHLDALAATKDVAGLTGYSLRPLCDVTGYEALESPTAVDLIRFLADEIDRHRGLQA